MTSFYDIPYVDILEYLSEYNIEIPDDEDEARNIAWMMASQNMTDEAPATIADFVISYRLYQDGIEIPNVSVIDVLLSDEDKLRDLVDLLQLDEVDKMRIIRILSYSNRLIDDIQMYTDLPDPIMESILDDLSCEDIIVLCNISENFTKYCKDGIYGDIIKRKIETKMGIKSDRYDMDTLLKICMDNVNYI